MRSKVLCRAVVLLLRLFCFYHWYTYIASQEVTQAVTGSKKHLTNCGPPSGPFLVGFENKHHMTRQHDMTVLDHPKGCFVQESPEGHKILELRILIFADTTYDSGTVDRVLVLLP